MAETTAYTCDECGRTKGASNHWYRAARLTTAAPQYPRLICATWEQGPLMLADGDTELHLCGMDCLTKCMSKAMQNE